MLYTHDQQPQPEDTTGATSGAGSAYPSGEPELTFSF